MKYKIGITGNYYFTSIDRQKIVEVCTDMGKAQSSIYFNKKHGVWVIRIKSKSQKALIRQKYRHF